MTSLLTPFLNQCYAFRNVRTILAASDRSILIFDKQKHHSTTQSSHRYMHNMHNMRRCSPTHRTKHLITVSTRPKQIRVRFVFCARAGLDWRWYFFILLQRRQSYLMIFGVLMCTFVYCLLLSPFGQT